MPFIENTSGSEEEKKELIDLYKNTTDDEDKYQSPVVSASTEMIEMYNKQASQKIDIEKFEKGEICLLGFARDKETSDFYLGRNITIIDMKVRGSSFGRRRNYKKESGKRQEKQKRKNI